MCICPCFIKLTVFRKVTSRHFLLGPHLIHYFTLVTLLTKVSTDGVPDSHALTFKVTCIEKIRAVLTGRERAEVHKCVGWGGGWEWVTGER